MNLFVFYPLKTSVKVITRNIIIIKPKNVAVEFFFFFVNPIGA